jgi:signal transduction histidine kinase
LADVPDPVARLLSTRRGQLDLLAAAALTTVSLAILVVTDWQPALHALPVTMAVLGFTALVGWCRRPGIVAIAGALLVVPEVTGNTWVDNNNALSVPLFAALFVYAYALGATCPWRRSLVGLIPLTAGAAFAAESVNPLMEMVTIGPWLGGLVVASRRRAAEQLALRARELEEERELFTVQSVRYERARIARELHDIVAHCVSLMVVQASAGERLLQRDPSSAAEALNAISETARQAGAELGRLVELLATASAASPSAELRIIDDLVSRARASGVQVSCQFSGDCEDLSEQSAEAAYRLVQEAVTNAMKHAPRAPIAITVLGHPEAIEVQVVNQPTPGVRSDLAEAGGGHGLAGMRERVARCDGTLEAGSTADRGWRVRARLPRHPHGRASSDSRGVIPCG